MAAMKLARLACISKDIQTAVSDKFANCVVTDSGAVRKKAEAKTGQELKGKSDPAVSLISLPDGTARALRLRLPFRRHLSFTVDAMN